jgi:hypothetical protein
MPDLCKDSLSLTTYPMLKQLIIPVAAFAVTATSASAFMGTDLISKLDLNLTDEQTTALEEAAAIREAAHEEAAQVLEDAGIDETKMREIHTAMREAHQESFAAVKTAIENNDYTAFTAAVADSPMAEAIDSETDFTKLVEAHELREAGDHDGARAIMEELGLEGRGGFGGFGHGPRGERGDDNN